MPDLSRNLPLFIAFRICFNARFYYPVLGVLFLDLGLTLEQYALLNVVWAVTIIALEIPSGAMADVIGRKRMVVAASVLMVAEMLIFAFAPLGDASLLFALLVVNRILSGTAEAAASGADEALAFDSLDPANRETEWPRFLQTLMRWKSVAFFCAMMGGAALYDQGFISALCAAFGITPPDPGSTVRWPVFATLLMSFGAVAAAVAMREPARSGFGESLTPFRDATRAILVGARFVFSERRVFLLICTTLLIDSAVRIFLTFGSNYYRLIELPEVIYGVVGSSLALLGFFAATVAGRLVKSGGPVRNLGMVAAMILIGLIGTTFATPWIGVWVVIPIGLGMALLNFFTSNYLNQWTTSDMRATVLSFRGVALNLGYGTAGLLFAGITNSIRNRSEYASENAVFAEALWWLPVGFLIGMVALGCLAMISRKAPRNCASA